MKKWFIIIIATAVLSAVAIIIFINKEKENNLFARIPIDSKSVIVVDFKSLTTKLFIDELGSDKKSSGKFLKMLPDSIKEIDWSNCGISLLGKAAVFIIETDSSKNPAIFLLGNLSDAKEFEDFINTNSNSLNIKILAEKNFAYSDKYQLLLHWDKNQLLMSLKSGNNKRQLEYLKKVLTLKHDESILHDSIFEKKMAGGYDVLVYSKTYNRPNQYMQFIKSNIKWFSAGIVFSDGELEIESEIELIKDQNFAKLFDAGERELNKPVIPEDCAFNLMLNLNPEAFMKIVDEFSNIKFDTNKFPLLKSWDGRLDLLVNTSKTIDKEYISYDFDDDFNKVEVKKVTREKVSDVQAVIGLDESVLDSINKERLLFKSGRDTLLFQGSGFTLRKSGNNFISYNRNLNVPKILKESTISPLNFTIYMNNFKQVFGDYVATKDSLLFTKFSFEKMELQAGFTDNFQVKCKLYYTDKEKNAFFSTFERWDTLLLNKDSLL